MWLLARFTLRRVRVPVTDRKKQFSNIFEIHIFAGVKLQSNFGHGIVKCAFLGSSRDARCPVEKLGKRFVDCLRNPDERAEIGETEATLKLSHHCRAKPDCLSKAFLGQASALSRLLNPFSKCLKPFRLAHAGQLSSCESMRYGTVLRIIRFNLTKNILGLRSNERVLGFSFRESVLGAEYAGRDRLAG